MKLRIKFAKTGNMKYIGHLDIMRYFQRAVRRAGIPIKYSEGFSPHQIMSFASPLGVGFESTAEYFDIELTKETEHIDCQQVVDSLNLVMCPGMEVISAVILPEKAKNAMASVNAADYEVVFKNDYSEIFNDFMNSSVFNISKITDKGDMKTTDIRSLVHDINANKETAYMRLCQGSEKNIKPTTILSALNIDSSDVVRIIRREIYAEGFVPLDSVE